MEISKSNIKRYSLFPKSIGKSIEPLIKPIYKKHGFAEHRILTQWHQIVGTLANYSSPQKLTIRGKEGTLHILVASGRALELQHLQPIILDKIATYFGYRAVTRITFSQTSSALFHKKIVKKLPLKEKPSEIIMKITSTCEDEDIRNALASLGAALQTVTKNS